MLTDYARYLWFRLTHTWYGLVYAVLYVAISLASGASVARSLRGFMIPVAREQWHTDCLGVYGDIVVFGAIVGSMFVAGLFLSDLRTGFAKNVFSGRRARPAYAASMVAVAAAVSLALLVVGIAVVELAFFVSPSWLDRPGAGTCLAWFGQAFLYCSAAPVRRRACGVPRAQPDRGDGRCAGGALLAGDAGTDAVGGRGRICRPRVAGTLPSVHELQAAHGRRGSRS